MYSVINAARASGGAAQILRSLAMVRAKYGDSVTGVDISAPTSPHCRGQRGAHAIDGQLSFTDCMKNQRLVRADQAGAVSTFTSMR